jgi:hypothetical protein
MKEGSYLRRVLSSGIYALLVLSSCLFFFLSLLSEPEEIGEIFLQLSPDYMMLHPTDEASLSILFPELTYPLLLSDAKSV